MAEGPNKPNRPIRPRHGAPPRGKRRVVIEGGGQRGGRPDQRQARERQETRGPKQPPGPAPTGPVTVESGITVQDFSQALGVRVPRIITILMSLGAPKTQTQSLTDEEVELIATELQREVTIKHVGEEDVAPEVFEDDEADL